MFFNRRWVAWALAGALAVAAALYSGCGSPAPSGPRRVALLPFEYQGSNAADRWLSDGFEAATAEQMRGVSGVIAIRASDAGAAVAEDATEALRGIVSGSPQALRLQLYLEDLAAPRMRVRVRVLGDNHPLPLAEALPALRSLLASAGLAGTPFSTDNPKAFEAFARALDTRDPARSVALLGEATSLDPEFSSAGLRLAALLQRMGEPARAVEEAERLLKVLPAARALERAYAALQLASLQTNEPGIEAALAGIVKASPGDLEAAGRLVAIHERRRDYPGAVSLLRDMARVDGQNYALWNQIVYAEAFSGNRSGAGTALAEYRKLRPQDPNVEDSSGDVAFFFGDFVSAAAAYQKANRLDPRWQNGFPLFKAAWAHMLAAELDAADTAMESYLAAIRPSNGQLAALRSAQWQFLRGRRAEARSSLTAILNESGLAPGYRALIASQLYVWDISEGLLEILQAEFRAGKPRYGLQITPAMASLFAGSAPGLTPSQRAEAISKGLGGSAPEALVAAATFLGARLRPPLGADGFRALVVADQAIPEASALFTHALVGWGYLERGAPAEAALAFARRIPPVASDDGILWPLVFPEKLAWELDAWSRAGQAAPLPQWQKLAGELIPGKAPSSGR